MKLPKSIKIGPHKVTVQYVPGLQTVKDVWGYFNPKTLTIVLSDGAPTESHLLDTFIHELFHAIWYVYNIKDEDDEERTVHTMATGLTDVLLNNPKIKEVLLNG